MVRDGVGGRGSGNGGGFTGRNNSTEIARVASDASALMDPDWLEAAWVAGVAEMAMASPAGMAFTEEAGVATGASTFVDTN